MPSPSPGSSEDLRRLVQSRRVARGSFTPLAGPAGTALPAAEPEYVEVTESGADPSTQPRGLASPGAARALHHLCRVPGAMATRGSSRSPRRSSGAARGAGTVALAIASGPGVGARCPSPAPPDLPTPLSWTPCAAEVRWRGWSPAEHNRGTPVYASSSAAKVTHSSPPRHGPGSVPEPRLAASARAVSCRRRRLPRRPATRARPGCGCAGCRPGGTRHGRAGEQRQPEHPAEPDRGRRHPAGGAGRLERLPQVRLQPNWPCAWGIVVPAPGDWGDPAVRRYARPSAGSGSAWKASARWRRRDAGRRYIVWE